MSEQQTTQSRRQLFRETIKQFIDQRREEKLKGQLDEQGKYEYHNWLESAAKRVSQIHAVTHTLKATNSDARGTSLRVEPTELSQHKDIGTHALGNHYALDVVGNAAALDVFKFLKLEVEGKILLEWAKAKDPDFMAALSSDEDTAQEWTQNFAALDENEAAPQSHALAKQLLWLVGDEPSDDSIFHVIQPLFSSALVHAVHEQVQYAKFSQENKQARKAKRENKPFEGVFQSYPSVVSQKLGGTKPQNISQLNSERGGVNYLLQSNAPKWNPSNKIRVLGVSDILPQFYYFEGVRDELTQLSELLKSNPDNTMHTRQKRESLEHALADLLVSFGASIQASHAPGWSRDPNCYLPRCQQLWLDSERLELEPRPDEQAEDEAFDQAYIAGEWMQEIATRYAHWLNAYLRKKGIKGIGDTEHQHFAKQLLINTFGALNASPDTAGVIA